MEMQSYDSPPAYSPPLSVPHPTHSPSQLYEGRRALGSLYGQGQPQGFHECLSPPGLVRALQGLTAGLSFIVFTCATSALVWDMGYSAVPGLGGHGVGVGGYGTAGSGHSSSHPTPYSAKAAIIAVAVINFLSALAFLAGSFSRTSMTRGRRFYLAVLLVDITMAVLQAAADVVFVIGVNPMTQGSAHMLQNPMLLMCQNLDGDNAWEGAGGVGGFPMYTQYLSHYCYMDAQEIVAMVCGFLSVFTLAMAAYFAHKTRSKILRHGKHNIEWEPPLGAPEGYNLQDWANGMKGGQSIHDAPTLLLSEKAAKSVISYCVVSDSLSSKGTGPGCVSSEASVSCHTELQGGRGVSSNPVQPLAQRAKRRDLGSEGEESQYGTRSTAGGEANADPHMDEWRSLYPEITSDGQWLDYKKQFDSKLKQYKRLQAEMDSLNHQKRKLRQELDTLPAESSCPQMYTYQTKKRQCRELRQELLYIKSLVRTYDGGRYKHRATTGSATGIELKQ